MYGKECEFIFFSPSFSDWELFFCFYLLLLFSLVKFHILIYLLCWWFIVLFCTVYSVHFKICHAYTWKIGRKQNESKKIQYWIGKDARKLRNTLHFISFHFHLIFPSINKLVCYKKKMQNIKNSTDNAAISSGCIWKFIQILG